MSLLKGTGFLLAGCLLLFPWDFSLASGQVSVSPAIISEKTGSPGILEYNIKLENNSQGKSDIYVIVRDIVDGGEKKYKDPSELPMLTSPTRWIEVKRSIELLSEESKEIPLKVNIPSGVEPGFYHVAVTFAQGSNRTQAEQAAEEKNELKLIINLEIEKHEIEKAEVVNFSAGGGIITKFPVNFSVKIKNIGNKEVIPEGEIVIYDGGGRLVDSVKVAEVRETIYPGADQEYRVSWSSERKFGKFKAKLMMYYGADQKDLQDIISFVLLPLPLLIVLVVFIVAVVALFTFLLLKRNASEDVYEQHEESNQFEEENNKEKTSMKKEAARSLDLSRKDIEPSHKRINNNHIIDLKSKR